jgi:hypothetical protein
VDGCLGILIMRYSATVKVVGLAYQQAWRFLRWRSRPAPGATIAIYDGKSVRLLSGVTEQGQIVAGGNQMAQGHTRETIQLSATFFKFLRWISGICLFFFLVYMAIAYILPPQTHEQYEVFNAVGFAWQSCLGAIIGMFTSKFT